MCVKGHHTLPLFSEGIFVIPFPSFIPTEEGGGKDRVESAAQDTPRPTTYLQHETTLRHAEAQVRGREVGDLHLSHLLVRVVQDQGQRPRGAQADISEAEERGPAEVAERQRRRGSRLLLGRWVPPPLRRPAFRRAQLPAGSPHSPVRHGSLRPRPGLLPYPLPGCSGAGTSD